MPSMHNQTTQNRNDFIATHKAVALSHNHPITETALGVIYEQYFDTAKCDKSKVDDDFILQFSEVALQDFVEKNAKDLEQVGLAHGGFTTPYNPNKTMHYLEMLDTAQHNNLRIDGKLFVGGYEVNGNQTILVLRNAPSLI